MNFQKMMENMKYAAVENAQVFGTPQPQIFVSERTPEGDLLVLRAHAPHGMPSRPSARRSRWD